MKSSESFFNALYLSWNLGTMMVLIFMTAAAQNPKLQNLEIWRDHKPASQFSYGICF